jgi:hypothetical protein
MDVAEVVAVDLAELVQQQRVVEELVVKDARRL